MPIYEYRCKDCQQLFEEWLKTFDDKPRACPFCKGEAERVMSNTTFVLKGGGWYVTEYGNRKDENSAGSKKSAIDANGSADAAAASSGDSPVPAAPAAPASSVAAESKPKPNLAAAEAPASNARPAATPSA
jgi:putative FmdB family regulatory protein